MRIARVSFPAGPSHRRRSHSALREARPSDVAVVEGVANAAFAPYVSRIGREPAPMGADYRAAIARGGVTVAELGGVVVGFLETTAHGDHLTIDTLAVAPTSQGRGVGRALLAHADHAARALGARRLELFTNVAMSESLAFYARAGFVETDRRTEDGFQRVYLRRDVA